jgi:hypothetical protein
MGNVGNVSKKERLVGKELNDAIEKVVLNGNVSGLRELLETYDDDA